MTQRMPSPPGPKKQFLLGHLSEYGKDPLRFLTKCAREFGDIVQLQFPRQTRVFLLNHPDYIESVLTANHGHFVRHRGMQLRASRRLLGNGLLTSEGSFSRTQRQLAQPAFYHEQITAYSRVMIDFTARMLTGWRSGEVRDLQKEMMHLTLGIVAKCLFGVDVSSTTGELATNALEILKDEFSAQRNRKQSLSAIFAMPLSRRTQQSLRQLDQIIADIIAARRAIAANGDLLSLLLVAQEESGPAIQQLRDEVMTFFFAGHEASGLALAWTWYLLAVNPDTQDQLIAEVRSVLHGRAPTAADLSKLRYTSCVVKETLRLYPPAWAIGREALQACIIGDYPVAPGTQLIMSQWITHRDPRFFTNPESFQPSRWLEGSNGIPKYAYFPYGAGERLCIGKGFADMEMILIVAMTAQRFRFELVSNQEIVPLPTFALAPKDGIRLKVISRSK